MEADQPAAKRARMESPGTKAAESKKSPGGAPKTKQSRMASLTKLVSEICAATPEGVSQPDLEKFCAQKLGVAVDLDLRKDLLDALNKLLKKSRLVPLKRPDSGVIFWKERTAEQADLLQSLSEREAHVYQLIADKKDAGIWKKHIKERTNFSEREIKKILKDLEKKKLVKTMKSVLYKTRAMYFLYNITPSLDHSGGPWYNGQEFDAEFIAVLNKGCHQYVIDSVKTNKRYASIDDIVQWVGKTGISKVVLTEKNMLEIMHMLLYDGKVEEVQHGKTVRYKALSFGGAQDSLSAVPCGVCPVFNDCSPKGLISPATCVYMDEWLSF